MEIQSERILGEARHSVGSGMYDEALEGEKGVARSPAGIEGLCRDSDATDDV